MEEFLIADKLKDPRAELLGREKTRQKSGKSRATKIMRYFPNN